ncbi:zinc finger protein 260-like [Ischnura elegans]|uniref:zinc finger protein 260-like n=1 Tax=Ischnura elegans TaxID=197161 RepID=UPI001ED86700|nr:zinc finger protein 260-like [Ischnura elegans]
MGATVYLSDHVPSNGTSNNPTEKCLENLRSFEGGGAADDNSEHSVETKGCIQDVVENNSQASCSAQTTEIYIPVPGCLLPRDDKSFHIKDEKEDQLSEENYPVLYTSVPAGSDASDPLATDDLNDHDIRMQLLARSDNKTRPLCEIDTHRNQIVADLDYVLNFHVKEENQDHLSEENYPEQNTSDPAGISNYDSAPLITDELCDPVTYKCSSFKEDQISNDEGHVHNDCTDGVLSKLVHQNSSDQPNTLTDSREEKVEALGKGAIIADLDAMLIGPKKEPSPEENAQPTSCEDGDQVESLTNAHEPTTETSESSIRDVTLTTLLLSESSSSCEPATSKTSYGPEGKTQGSKKEGNGPLEETKGGKEVEKAITQVASSLTVEDKLTSQNFSSESSHIRRGRNDLVAKKKEKPYSCNECEKSFSSKSHLVMHLRSHTGEKPFSCRICRKSFTQKSALKSHIQTHTGEKPFTCNECGKSYTKKGTLVSHMITHTGDKPYSCKECGKSFSRKGDLAIHYRTHTGEKPYSCSICCKSFTVSSSLGPHMRTHSGEKPYSCGICKKCFSGKGALKCHVRIHTGEKPYDCNVCGKSFRHRGTLLIHTRRHTREKPYSCCECEMSFSARSHLVTHVRRHSEA